MTANLSSDCCHLCARMCYYVISKWGRAGSTGDGLYRIAGRGATHRVKSGKKVTGNDREFALAA